jgi:hypothetical protein
MHCDERHGKSQQCGAVGTVCVGELLLLLLLLVKHRMKPALVNDHSWLLLDHHSIQSSTQ